MSKGYIISLIGKRNFNDLLVETISKQWKKYRTIIGYTKSYIMITWSVMGKFGRDTFKSYCQKQLTWFKQFH